MEKENNRNVALRLTGVKKRYRLGQIGGGTLTADLQSWWARLRGKEDPNTLIGTDQRLVGKTFIALNGIALPGRSTGHYRLQRCRQKHHAEAALPGHCAYGGRD